MTRLSNPESRTSGQGNKLLPGVVMLAFGLVAGLWGVQHFSTEARIRRATERIVKMTEKAGEESPVALGLAANRLGDRLETEAVLEMDGWGELAHGRTEIVQLFAQIRASLVRIEFMQPRIAVAAGEGGERVAQVDARYRMAADGGEVAEGDGEAALHWRRGDDGWRIGRVQLKAAEGAMLPGGWK